MELTGLIIEKPFAVGSKSEQPRAVVLKTDKGEYVLRKRGENPFENAGLRPYVGKKVRVTGEIQNYLFFAHSIEIA